MTSIYGPTTLVALCRMEFPDQLMTTLVPLFCIASTGRGIGTTSPVERIREGYLFVSSTDFNTIQKFTPGGVGSPFASGLAGPVGLAFDSSGNLYSVNIGPYDGQNFKNGYIEKYTPGGQGTVFAADPGDGSVLAAPEFIAIIPEPTALVLFGLGSISLLRRRGV